MPGSLASLAPHLLPIARRSIEGWLRGETYQASPLPDDQPRGCFVTLWTAGRELRGCIGHVEPRETSLAREVAECAILAASRDPRFAPVTVADWPGVSLEISLLTPPEPVLHLQSLDPREIGVVVSCGSRRGVLLPGVAGVDTPEEQLAIALRKGGIRPHEPWQVHAFHVVKLTEQAPFSEPSDSEL